MPNVPDRSWYDPVFDAHLHIGRNAIDAIHQLLSTTERGTVDVATDIETPGLENAFTINCVTAAWRGADGDVHSVLLDPDRAENHDVALTDLYRHADSLILHNAPFDTPALFHSGLFGVHDINRIVDTLLLARFALPDTMIRKSLSALVDRFLGWTEFSEGMKLAFKAAGYSTIAAGFAGMDIDSPIYRVGAMADTIGTLLLEPMLRTEAIRWTTNHPFSTYGATTDAEAAEILGTQETVHRVMLRRTAKGLAVDPDYLASYVEEVDQSRQLHVHTLAEHGLEGGSGKGAALVDYLFLRSELPEPWPRTPTGKLKATKDLLDGLDHPLAAAQRGLAHTDKVLGYLDKVERQAAVTGRCHPQVGVLGASATGRMSYGMPELQQFPADARPILCHPEGLTSIDWSQIEPVTMALMAKDTDFLAPFESGEDLYEPIMIAAGIDRPLAKVVLLATMYGQGTSALARRIGHTEESASQIRRQMLAAMPNSARWMTKVQGIAEQYGRVITAGGRILPVDSGGVFKAVNYTVQGSAYDVLAATIVEMERRGIGDELHLAMHDEVVVTTAVGEEVQEIMLTPPPFLERWAERTPKLRTDRADMGTAWQKV
ncbi:DNA polymerase I [Gordonia phage Evaa]|nr:DNA polymerase I [Gordonia phage Evaa]